VIGTGLIKGTEGGASWTTLGHLDGEKVMLRFAVGPDRLYAVTQHNEIVFSRDGGQSWVPYASGGQAAR